MSMLHKPGWDRSLARWHAFWNGELADRPPLIAHITTSSELEVGGGITSFESEIAHFDPDQNQERLARAESGTATFYTSNDVDDVVRSFAP